MILSEFNIAMEAYEWKVYQERVRNAEHALWTLSPHIKDAPSIKDLVGLAPGEVEEKEEKKVTTQDDLEEMRSEEHTSELQSRFDLVCRLLLEKKKKQM